MDAKPLSRAGLVARWIPAAAAPRRRRARAGRPASRGPGAGRAVPAVSGCECEAAVPCWPHSAVEPGGWRAPRRRRARVGRPASRGPGAGRAVPAVSGADAKPPSRAGLIAPWNPAAAAPLDDGELAPSAPHRVGGLWADRSRCVGRGCEAAVLCRRRAERARRARRAFLRGGRRPWRQPGAGPSRASAIAVASHCS
jgi:hypothetical protein